MMGRRGLTEGAVLQTPSYKKRSFWQIGQSTLVKPVIAGLLLIVLGALFIPSCAAVSTPVASFVSTVTTGTTPLTVQFLDSSTNSPTSWSWSFGDGGTSALQNPSHAYSVAGTYTVTLTASNTAGSDTATQTGYVTVSSAATGPVASFVSTVTAGTTPLTVQFLDSSTNSPKTWAWSFGDGSTSALQNPSHTYATAGTYTVTLTATNAAGSNTVTQTGYIVVSAVSTIPVAAFLSTVVSGTVPCTVQFLDYSTNTPASWVWSFGDGNTSTLENPSHTYVIPGTYTVTLTATNTAGSNTVTKSGYITVTYTVPVAGFTSNVTSGTTPLYVRFTDISTNTPTSWSWTFGDGGTATTQSPVYEYTDEGTYTVSLTATNSAGSNTTYSTGYITVESIISPVVSFSADVKSGTVPFTVRFTDTSSYTPTSWEWSFGDGSSSTQENPVHTYTTAGSYSVTHTATNAGGSRTTTASSYITASSVTTVPTTVATISTTATTPMTTAAPAATVAGDVTTTADSGSDSLSIFYIIVGIFVIAVIGIAALFFFRRPPGGRHVSWDRQL
jgi:PKD repeat protein